MSLSCERAGYGPNGRLNAAEQRVYDRFKYTSPTTRSPMRYVYETIFHSKSLGFCNTADFPERTTPMVLDPAPRPDDSDIDMCDAPPVRTVAFTPPHDYSRPSTSSISAEHAMPRTALSQRIHLINQTELYVPKEPYALDPDVDYSHPSLHDLSFAGRTPPAKKSSRPINHFSPPADDSSFSDISTQNASTPLPYSPRVAGSWRIAPPKSASALRISPQGRPILSPVSPRLATSPRTSPTTSPPSRILSPQELYPRLQSAGCKRPYQEGFISEQDLAQAARAYTVGGMITELIKVWIPNLVKSIWGFLKRRGRSASQEIVGVSRADGSKRRAMAKQDVESGPIPGYYPGLETNYKDVIAQPASSATLQSQDASTTLATPPDSRSPSVEDTSPLLPGHSHTVTQNSHVRGSTQTRPSFFKPRVAPSEEAHLPHTAAAQHSRSMKYTPQAPQETDLKPADEGSGRPPRLSTESQSQSATSVSQIRALTGNRPGQRRIRPVNYGGAARLIKERGAFIPISQRGAYQHTMRTQEDRAREEQLREDNTDAIVQRVKDVMIESPQEKAVRESVRTRKHREAEQNRTKEEAAAAKRAEEEAKLQAEREAEEARQKEQEDRKQAEEDAKAAAAEQARRKEARERFLPPISTEWRERIAERLATTDPRDTVAKSTRGVELTRRTFGCILPQSNESNISAKLGSDVRQGPSGWLNDEGVDGFIGAIVDRKREQEGYVKGAGTPSYAALSCGWYTSVRKSGMKSISRWARRQQVGGQNLLGAEKIFLPVNTGAHWVLLIVSPKEKTLEFLDSAGGSGRSFFKVAREWLAMELGQKYEEAAWTELDSRSEQQLNMDDCGVFTCMNALASAKGVDFGAVRAVRDMKGAREYITSVLMDGGFGRDFEL